MNSNTLWLNIPAAKTHSNHSIKNTCALNKLNYITAKLSDLQGTIRPYLGKTTIILFINNHDVVVAGKTSLAEQTKHEKIKSFNEIKNIINKKLCNSSPKIKFINLGSESNVKHIKGLVHASLGLNVEHFSHRPAMRREQLAKAINLGRQTAQRIKLNGNKVFIAREVNEANILSATAIAVALLDINIEELSFLDNSNKHMISQAITTHKKHLTSAIEIVHHLGSFEIAALTGSFLCCAHMGLPILVDGYVSTVAALIVSKICPTATPWFLFSQPPSNIIHSTIYQRLNAKPLLQNSGRFEGISGITSALSLIQLAYTSHNEITHYKTTSLYKVN